jgi:glucosamine-phosphate N-acetyltransferase
MNETVIRRLNKNDYNKFYTLIKQFRDTTFTEEQFMSTLEKIQSSGNQVWIIENDNNFIASATIIFDHKFIHNICCSAHIEDVIVDKQFRYQGYGKMIMNHLVNIATQHECYKVTLDCDDEYIYFYEHCGFAKKGNHMVYIIK